MSLSLFRLQLPSDWRVVFHNFADIEDVRSLTNWEREAYLDEDLLSADWASGGLSIDVGWYPSYDVKGTYQLRLVRSPFEAVVAFDHPRGRKVLRAVEAITHYVSLGYPPERIVRELLRSGIEATAPPHEPPKSR